MSEVILTIPDSMWLTANGRYHWADRARRTRDIRHAARVMARHIPHHAGPVRVVAHIGYPTAQRADPANAAPTVKAAGRAGFAGRIRSAPGGATNTLRGLTHSSDLSREGLA